MTEENSDPGPQELEDLLESDLAVEPDAKVAEELRMLSEDKHTTMKKWNHITHIDNARMQDEK